MKGKQGGDLNGFLDHGSSFTGELEFEDTMRIDGKFKGKITSKNELIVGETATIDGDIHVGRIAISGTVLGKIKADGFLIIPYPQSHGRIDDLCKYKGHNKSIYRNRYDCYYLLHDEP